jgi:ferredoxin-NADP reductase
VQLIIEEARLYQRAGVDPARPFRPWRIAARVPDAEDVVSFELIPADGGPTPSYLPGQYVSVAVGLPDGRRQPRQYTLSNAPGTGSLRITVRRVTGTDGSPDGAVSGFLHDAVKAGDLLDLSAPAGDATLPPGDDPLLLVSVGIGITPMVAMLAHLAVTQPDREVVVAHADRSPHTHPLRAEVLSLGRRLRSIDLHTWYERSDRDLAAHERTGSSNPRRCRYRPAPGSTSADRYRSCETCAAPCSTEVFRRSASGTRSSALTCGPARPGKLRQGGLASFQPAQPGLSGQDGVTDLRSATRHCHSAPPRRF